MPKRRIGGWIFLSTAILWNFGPVAGAVKPPAPPTGVRGVRQDAQAARIQWNYKANGLGYVLYAAFDDKSSVFHRENETPMRQNFIVWDAPRGRGTRFVFYVTAVDADGHESAPSRRVHVDLSRR